MRNMNNTTDSCLDAHEMGTVGDDRLRGAARTAYVRGFGLIWMAATGVALLLCAGSAFGQYGSFTVTPMRVELKVTPGKTVNTVLYIQNLDPNETFTVDVSVVELTQSLAGDWMIVEPNSVTDPNSPSFGFDLRRLSSCSNWIRMKSDAVDLEPSQRVPVEVSIKVQRGKRGFFTAGILAAVQPRPGMVGVPVSVQFIVPVVVEIETRPPRARVQATGVGLKFVKAGGAGLATTLVTMGIQNNGGTLSQLKPLARIYAFSQNHWHLVTTTEFPDKRIIPGAILNLEADTGRVLPSGKYRVRGELYVDGRRTKPVESIIDFVGDPRINKVAADAPLDLKPLDLTLDCAPGSLRTGTMTVFNASDETVNVQVASGLPSQLQAVVRDTVKGIDLDCTNWLQITPQAFTLAGGGGRHNVQVVARLPAGATHPCYYSLLALWAAYPDGQRAGFKTANIFVRNSSVAAQPAAAGLSVGIQDLDESKYLVTARFSNLTTIHFKPLTVKAGVIPATGALAAQGIARVSAYLRGDPRPMLPFEDRTFTGDLDFSTLPAGRYLLTGRLEFAPGEYARANRIIDISIEGDKRIVQTVGTQMELGETVEVVW
jgi:hypothetical protein